MENVTLNGVLLEMNRQFGEMHLYVDKRFVDMTNLIIGVKENLEEKMDKKEKDEIITEMDGKMDDKIGKAKDEIIMKTEEKIVEVRKEIGNVKSELKEEIGNVKEELREEIGNVKSELKEEIGNVKEELRNEIKSENDKLRNDFKSDLVSMKNDIVVFIQDCLESLYAMDKEKIDSNTKRIEKLEKVVFHKKSFGV